MTSRGYRSKTVPTFSCPHLREFVGLLQFALESQMKAGPGWKLGPILLIYPLLAGGCSGHTSIPATPNSIPAAPNSVSATMGNTEVALRWIPVSGATSYHVKRSTTAGGPYTQIATPTFAGYTDVSCQNGTMYYYVVSAANGLGESSNSAQVSAKPQAIVTPQDRHRCQRSRP